MPVLLQGDGGKLVYAVDALFGLPRKKAAGVSHREPLHGHLFFLDSLQLMNMLLQVKYHRNIGMRLSMN